MKQKLEEMKSIKDTIYQLLHNNPRLRDDDNKLIANIYIKELGGLDKVKQMSAFDFLTVFASGSLTSTESIRRTRCKVQEEDPKLRGECYHKKQVTGVIVSHQIKDL
jgi:hypothetical protein